MRINLLVVVCLLASSVVLAEEPAGNSSKPESWISDFAERPSLTLSTMVKSGYLLSNGTWSSDQAVLQSDAYMAFKNGLYIDIWNSAGLESRWNDGFDDEVDLGLGWSGSLGQSGLDANVGVYYFDMNKVFSFNSEDMVQLYGEFSPTKSWQLTEAQTLKPYCRFESNRDLNGGDSTNFETYLYGGLKHVWTLNDKFSVSQKLYGVYDPGVYGLDSGFLLNWEGNLDWTIGKGWTWNALWVRQSIPLNVSDERGNETVFGTGVSYSF